MKDKCLTVKILTVVALFICHSQSIQAQPVSLDGAGNLVYNEDESGFGNVVPDFSATGYEGGARGVPAMTDFTSSRTEYVATSPVDTFTSRLQNAIYLVSQMSVITTSGVTQDWRGLVLVESGTHSIENIIVINSNGILISGEGRTLTIIEDNIDEQHEGAFIFKTGDANWSDNEEDDEPDYALTGNPANNGLSYNFSHNVNIGDKTFTLSSDSHTIGTAANNGIEEWIVIVRDIDTIDDDDQGCSLAGGVDTWKQEYWESKEGHNDETSWSHTSSPWQSSPERRNHYRRAVAGIDTISREITLKQPMVEPLWEASEDNCATGRAMILTWSDSYNTNSGITNLGITNLSGDDAHGAIYFDDVKDNFASQIDLIDFTHYGVVLSHNSTHVLIDDVDYNVNEVSASDEVSASIVGSRYGFRVEGQLNVVKNSRSHYARHAFLTNGWALGPNVFFNNYSINSLEWEGPYHAMSTGTLYEQHSMYIDSQERKASQGGRTMFGNGFRYTSDSSSLRFRGHTCSGCVYFRIDLGVNSQASGGLETSVDMVVETPSNNNREVTNWVMGIENEGSYNATSVCTTNLLHRDTSSNNYGPQECRTANTFSDTDISHYNTWSLFTEQRAAAPDNLISP